MAVPSLSMPSLTAYDPPVAGEGSLDPMGLGGLSERLANKMIPSFRARMQRFRFLTAMAVSATSCSDLVDHDSSDGRTTWPVAFEWLLIEAFVRRKIPTPGVPGALKTKTVVARGERLSAGTYLKGPNVFGFHGVYKPLAVSLGIVTPDLAPGTNCAALTQAWERAHGLDGFTDGRPGTPGNRLRRRIRAEVAESLRRGRCATKTGSSVFGDLGQALDPAGTSPQESSVLRRLLQEADEADQAEIARLIDGLEYDTEEQALERLTEISSPGLRDNALAVLTYERFARPLNLVFRNLCYLSTALSDQPLLIENLDEVDTDIATAAASLPDLLARALDQLPPEDAALLDTRFGTFSQTATTSATATNVLEHHSRVQTAKGTQSWFETDKGGVFVRVPYMTHHRLSVDGAFVHPIRIRAVSSFLEDCDA